MKGVSFSSAAALLAATVFPATPALAQGPIGTVEQGLYVCELPGDAAGPRGVEQAGLGFRIENASRYSSEAGSGTYLRRGKELVFTSGPRNGERYQVVSPSFLRKMDGERLGRLRCVRRER
jgi:hypothetical protein